MLELSLKFGENVYFHKKAIPKNMKIVVDDEKSAVLYTCTTLYYNKFT
jgi:hypothetical protein